MSAMYCCSLSGYAALFKHPNDELNYCVYLIPGNPKVVPEDLPRWHDRLLKDPFISKALGSDFKIERMKAGVLNHSKTLLLSLLLFGFSPVICFCHKLLPSYAWSLYGFF